MGTIQITLLYSGIHYTLYKINQQSKITIELLFSTTTDKVEAFNKQFVNVKKTPQTK